MRTKVTPVTVVMWPLLMLAGLASAGDVAKLVSRSAGGKSAKLGQFPYQVIVYSWNSFCGGGILSEYIVITAAHCLDDSDTTVIAGAHIKHLAEKNQQVRKVSKVVVHSYFSPTTKDNDIALLRLRNPLNLNSFVKPIPLPPVDQVSHSFVGSHVALAGWGDSNESAVDGELMYVESTVTPNQHCQDYFTRPLQESQLCVSGEDFRGPCMGDFGGPLVELTPDGKPKFIIGVASFGTRGACNNGQPSVYTRITSHLSWIRANMRTLT